MQDKNTPEVTIIGGGLAGVEAAWKLGNAKIPTRLFEMRPQKNTPAHKTGKLAELVCSNSFKADGNANASGVLKTEMEALDSIVMKVARQTAVPAGGALAVDRETFSGNITKTIEELDTVEIVREELSEIPEGVVIIATGPLTSAPLAEKIRTLTGHNSLSFYDAIAPIVMYDSINMDIAFKASRYDKGGADYVNCPMNEKEYLDFHETLLTGRLTPLREFEDPKFYEGCLPVEVMASRGIETLAHGPMKPVGLIDPRTGLRPHAVVQLRQDDTEGKMYNMVGFQTRLARPEQEKTFQMIPGLENAEFARLGSIHRNTFIRSVTLLEKNMSLKSNPDIFFAGQITGVEGYLESASSGLMTGMNVIRYLNGEQPAVPPDTTIIGGLMKYVTDPEREDFQPMNANFGVIKKLGMKMKKALRKIEYGKRSEKEILEFIKNHNINAGR
jgi:methylenetetrahydrofolate--tRNA-(uracil-5-)-methyltransferase